MNVGVVTFPGSNCDDDGRYSLSLFDEVSVTPLWHKDASSLSAYDLIYLPGGFSYGDYLRCGAMAARSPIMEHVIEFAKQGGLVVGICNGFQILCEAGLLPGVLMRNISQKFICRDVYVKVASHQSPWTNKEHVTALLNIPIAHGDGRYVVETSIYETMKENGQVLFEYSDASANVTDASNPNGSVFNVAGVCNVSKNVMGMMPHPERAHDLRSKDGEKIWRSVIQFWKARSV